MKLLPREREKLGLHQAGFLAQKRLARGLRLNYTETVALIASQTLLKLRVGCPHLVLLPSPSPRKCWLAWMTYMENINIDPQSPPIVHTKKPPNSRKHMQPGVACGLTLIHSVRKGVLIADGEMNKEAQAPNLRVSEIERQSSERSFSEELWNECNQCCDLQQFFCCVTFVLFVLGVFAAIVTVLIYFRPVDINVTIQSVQVNNYTVIKRIEENNQSYYGVYVVAYINFVFLATNPSKKYTVVYSNSTFQCLTRNMSLGVFTTSAFRQSPLTSINWTRVLLLDVPEPVPSSLRFPIIQDAFVNGVVSLHIGGPIAARFEVAGIYFPSLEDTLNCTVEFKYLDQSNLSITC